MKSYSQLQADLKHLQEQIEIARRREAEGVIKRIREAVAVYGITAKDIFDAKGNLTAQKPAKKSKTKDAVQKSGRGGRPGKRPVKYADDKGHTWSGGGSMPVWMREYVEAGRSLDEFLVKREAA
jgi:DNA-binding protein H-NS